MPSECNIVRGLIAGDPGAMDAMYALHADCIWRFLMRLTQNQTVAEDLFQETWLAAAGHAHLLRDDSSLLRWLYTIARNAYRMSWRSRQADVAKYTQLHQACDPPRAADETLSAHIDLARARQAMVRLPEAYREVLVLCAWEGLSSEDAAAILDLSAEAVRKRLSRARAELIAMLGNQKESP